MRSAKTRTRLSPGVRSPRLEGARLALNAAGRTRQAEASLLEKDTLPNTSSIIENENKNLRAMASNLRNMVSNLIAMVSNLIAIASNLIAMASQLKDFRVQSHTAVVPRSCFTGLSLLH